MAEELIINHCSPTLAGIKTGSLFSAPVKNKSQAIDMLRGWNRKLSKKGIVFLPLKYRQNTVLVYAYRPSLLYKYFENKNVSEILSSFGYADMRLPQRISFLIDRLKKDDEFPHEIGLFLGYPPEDVLGFIKNGAANCKRLGCWKVYGDEESALKTFKKYEKCTEIYSKLWNKGRSLERLTVAV